MTAQELHEALRACGFGFVGDVPVFNVEASAGDVEADAVYALHSLLFGEITPADLEAEPSEAKDAAVTAHVWKTDAVLCLAGREVDGRDLRGSTVEFEKTEAP